jgi:hypothetical protein
MWLVCETTAGRYLRKLLVGGKHQLTGAVQAPRQEERVRRLSECTFERTTEVRCGAPRNQCQVGDPDRCVEVGLHICPHAVDLPRSKPAGRPTLGLFSVRLAIDLDL